MKLKLFAILAMIFLTSSVWALCPQQEATVVFVNGVWTTERDAEQHKLVLEREARKTGLSPDCVQFELSHTQYDGKTADIVEAIVQKSQELGISISPFVRMLLRIIPITRVFGDVVTEVYNQVDEVIDAQLDRHEAKVRGLALDKGHRAIIVTHSQGGLYGKDLRSRLSPADQADTRLVTIATPAGDEAEVAPNTRLLRDGVANLFFAFATEEGVIDNTERPCETEPDILLEEPPVAVIQATGRYSFACHGFETGYLHDPDARNKIIADVANAVPPPIQFSVLQGHTLLSTWTEIIVEGGATVQLVYYADEDSDGIVLAETVSDENGFYSMLTPPCERCSVSAFKFIPHEADYGGSIDDLQIIPGVTYTVDVLMFLPPVPM